MGNNKNTGRKLASHPNISTSKGDKTPLYEINEKIAFSNIQTSQTKPLDIAYMTGKKNNDNKEGGK